MRNPVLTKLVLEDARIAYDFQPAHGRDVLLFSNSLGADHRMWAAQVERLRGHFALLRYDTRGHGQSSSAAKEHTIEMLGCDVVALLDHLEIRRVHFCGLSMGGLIGQWLAVNTPERIGRLILSNTAARIGNVASWNERIAAVEASGLAAMVPAILSRWFTPGFAAAHTAQIDATREMLLTTSDRGYIANCCAVRDADLRAVLSGIAAPTLVLYGAQDPVTTEADARALGSAIPKAIVHGVEAAHLANIEAAAGWTDALNSFLSGEAGHG